MATTRDIYTVVALCEALTENQFYPGGAIDRFAAANGIPPGEIGQSLRRLGKECGTEAGWSAGDCEGWESEVES